ncbi:MAG: response regulator [Rhodospirillales bacterium]|nr:response regulator [Rhodospirillales bacterium]
MINAAAIAATEGPNIAIVDPSKHMRSVMKQFLRTQGYREFLEAGNGADGLKCLQRQTIDLIICEYQLMPVNGVEFARFVRRGKDSPAPEVPIIMVTGHTEINVVLAARDVGVNAIIAKPVSAKILLQHVTTLLKPWHEKDAATRKIAALSRPGPTVQEIARIMGEIHIDPEARVSVDTDRSSRALTDEEITSLFL